MQTKFERIEKQTLLEKGINGLGGDEKEELERKNRRLVK